jgi:hypothetical protein
VQNGLRELIKIKFNMGHIIWYSLIVEPNVVFIVYPVSTNNSNLQYRGRLSDKDCTDNKQLLDLVSKSALCLGIILLLPVFGIEEA